MKQPLLLLWLLPRGIPLCIGRDSASAHPGSCGNNEHGVFIFGQSYDLTGGNTVTTYETHLYLALLFSSRAETKPLRGPTKGEATTTRVVRDDAASIALRRSSGSCSRPSCSRGNTMTARRMATDVVTAARTSSGALVVGRANGAVGVRRLRRSSWRVRRSVVEGGRKCVLSKNRDVVRTLGVCGTAACRSALLCASYYTTNCANSK